MFRMTRFARMEFSCESSCGRENTFNIFSAMEKYNEEDDKNCCSGVEIARTNCVQGRFKEALHTLCYRNQLGNETTASIYFHLLKECTKLRALGEGKQLHDQIIRSGIDLNIMVKTTLVHMYTGCDRLNDAHCIFENMQERNVFTCKLMIRAFVQQGLVEDAIEVYHQMGTDGMKVDEVTFVSILKGCTTLKDLEEGKIIHGDIIKSGININIYIGNALVHMYATCGIIEVARQVFESMPRRSVVSWNAIISGYVRHGLRDDTLALFQRMRREALNPNKITFLSILNLGATTNDLKQGKQIHACIMETEITTNIATDNALADMYIKCGSIEDAHKVFNGMYEQNAVSWNTIMLGYVKQGHVEEVFKLFWEMVRKGVTPDEITFVTVLNACASQGNLKQAEWLLCHMANYGVKPNLFVANSLIDMYAKCGSIEKACLIFYEMPDRDIISWNSIIAGYSKVGNAKEVLFLFRQMEYNGIRPDDITLVSVLNSCASLGNLQQGEQIHSYIIKSAIKQSTFLVNSLLDMYAKCGSLDNVSQLFNSMPERNAMSWTAIIAGYTEHGPVEEAFTYFWEMEQSGVQPNEVTFLRVLAACGSLGKLEEGKRLHACVKRTGFSSEVSIGNALIEMYVRCGGIEYGWEVFEKMPDRDVISWTEMITGNSKHGGNGKAPTLFQEMLLEGVAPDELAFVSILNSLASLAALKMGREIHARLSKFEINRNNLVGNALIDMYAKAGSINEAQQVLNGMQNRDVVTWNAIISGYAQHGYIEQVLQLLDQMQQEGTKPDQITFVSILSACSHAGLEGTGHYFFDHMRLAYGITPEEEHYACMIDLHGRLGHLEEAEEVIRYMPVLPTAVVWRALLAACRIHGNIDLAEHAAKTILHLEPEDDAAFVILSNIYAASCRWDDQAELMKAMKARAAKVELPCS